MKNPKSFGNIPIGTRFLLGEPSFRRAYEKVSNSNYLILTGHGTGNIAYANSNSALTKEDNFELLKPEEIYWIVV